MKYPLFLGSILWMAPALAQAQIAPQDAPSVILPKSSSSMPALEAFAGMATRLQLQVRWVRISDTNLPANLPEWNKDGAWNRVATPAELKRLELMKQLGLATTTDQQIGALNNQSANLSYPPFASSLFFSLPGAPSPDLDALDEMIIPRDKPNFDAAWPYIPNLAKPESRLPDMAPMPGAGGKNDSPFASQNPALRPKIWPQSEDVLDYKFEIRPTIIGDQIALDLRSLNSAENIASLAKANFGETVVFAIPNIVEYLQSKETKQYQVKRTFLLVTPRLAPQPKRDLK